MNHMPLARGTVDRNWEDRRNLDLISRYLDRDDTQVLLVSGQLIPVLSDDNPAHVGIQEQKLAMFSPRDLSSFLSPSRMAFLGWEEVGFIAAWCDESEEEQERLASAFPDTTWVTLREVGSVLCGRDVGLATSGVALAKWHETNSYCPSCGERTHLSESGWARRCHAENKDIYPRIDPAVIMAVFDDNDRILLAHAVAWPGDLHSLIAGYVEAGESLEMTVKREVFEEVGIVCDDIRYVGSQPWPISGSLMVAFSAHATSTQIVVDGEEIAHAKWYTREEVDMAVVNGEISLPAPTAIAHSVIDQWRRGQSLD
jgi:NAD+ diphosphatase